MKKAIATVMKYLVPFCSLALCAQLSFAAADTLSASAADSLLKKVDANTAFMGTDFSANYTLVQDKPGQGKDTTTAVMFRRDDADSYTILITGPASDKGKGYVKFDQTIWYYDPKDRQFEAFSASRKLVGTNATAGDLSPQTFSKDYKIKSAAKVKLGKLDCVLFDLNAKGSGVAYPSIKLWVTADDGLIRKREDYSLSGQILRTTAIPSYQKFGGHSVPEKMVIVDNLRGKKINNKMQYEQTQVTVSNVSFTKQSNTVYTKKYVEMQGNTK